MHRMQKLEHADTNYIINVYLMMIEVVRRKYISNLRNFMSAYKSWRELSVAMITVSRDELTRAVREHSLTGALEALRCL